ncbi:Cof-type HAD-IIB family hydrolase [Kurthia senegalensis]|uniref:Cof-type HAD-IIB family hydrolase n=1 Tax=Kurthia senegalensis TaxID=1033740 RepID=UPI000288304B|nr:Cof-type HAD-IIB family hydrolase [Kurthia senegalensis]
MKKMKPKVVFFDIDGTLTTSDTGDIPLSAKESIRALQQQGIHVVAATGRPYSMCADLEELGIHTMITANGAYARRNDDIIYEARVEPTFQKQLMAFARVQGNALTFYNDAFYRNELETAQLSEAMKDAFNMTHLPPVLPSETCQVNLICLIATAEQMAPYEEKFPDIIFQRWHRTIVNALQRPNSKSIAIAHVLAYFGYTKEEAMAFGDGYNDVDMLTYVGFGIAMGNAPDAVKEHSDYVTKSAADNGIYEALVALNIIEQLPAQVID